MCQSCVPKPQSTRICIIGYESSFGVLSGASVVNLKARHYEICALSCLFACSQVLLMGCMTIQLNCHPKHQRRICYNFLSNFIA